MTALPRGAPRRTDPARAAGAAVAAPLAHALLLTAAVGGLTLVLRASDRTGQGPVAPLVVQASGLAALLWAYAALLLGLLVSTRPPRPSMPSRPGGRRRRPHRSALRWRAGTVTLHRQLSMAVIALTLAHALTFAWATPEGSVVVALVPWTAAYQQLGYTLGVLALYLAVILGPSFYLRRRIGRRTWLVAHQLAAVSYALSLWHALFLGSDLRAEGVPRTLTWAAQLPLLVLLVARLQRPLRPSDELDAARRAGRFGGRRHALARGLLVLAIAGTFAVVLVMTLLAISPGAHGTSMTEMRP